MKNKKQLINLTLGTIVLFLGIFLLTRNHSGKSTVDDDRAAYDMAIEDTASVTKIQIISKEPDEVVLTRESNGQWIVNGKFPARHDAVEVLLETFYGVRLRNYPQQSAVENIFRRMASYGKEVKVWSGDELIQDFIVGTDNLDQLGTYMMKKGGDQPFAMHIPGFNGYLSSRFFTREDLWKDRTIFGTDNLDIRTLEMEYGIVPEESFTITQNEESQLNVKDNNGLNIDPFQSQHTRFYLGSIRTLKYEGAILEDEGAYAMRDSIGNSIPVFTLTVTDKNGKTTSLRAHHVFAKPDTYDDKNQPLQWDPDHFYAFINDEQFVLIQTYAFENILKTKEYFRL